MAHFDKVGCGWRKVLDHDYRKHTDKRQNINKDLSYLNYDLINRKNPWKFVEDKIAESKKSGGRFQPKTVILCECVITIPSDFVGDERQFFEECKRVLDQRYGKENCVSAIVHKDEPGARAHLHYKSVPIVIKEKKYKSGKTKQIKQFAAKEIQDKLYLSYFHDQLQEELEAVFKCPVNVKTNESTRTQTEEIIELKKTIQNQTETIKEQKNTIKEQNEKIKKQNKFISTTKEILINNNSVFNIVMEYIRKKKIQKQEEKLNIRTEKEKSVADDILL